MRLGGLFPCVYSTVSFALLTFYLILKGQNAKTQDVEEQVGKRIAFVESLVNTSKSRDGSSSVGNKAAETPTEILNQQKEENVDRKDLKNEGNDCFNFILVAKEKMLYHQ